MLTMNVFEDDAFKPISMTTAIQKVDYVPSYLGSLNVFEKKGVRTKSVFIEERGSGAALIHTSEPGAPPKSTGGDKVTARSFKTVHFADSSRINAAEVAGIREFGSETELRQLQGEVVTRQAKLKTNADFTYEHYRFGVVTQGKMLDADGSVLYNWAAELNQTIPAAINFDLTAANPAPGALRKKCNLLSRGMVKNLKGLGGGAVTIHAIVGDDFFDDFISHPEVEKTYLNWQAAADLRNDHGTPYSTFRYGNVTWHNYRGSDNGEINVDAGEAHFFPVGAGIFQQTNSPLATFELANTVGEEFYSMVVRDKDRDMWADVEVHADPLFVCTMPSALRRGTRTA